MNIWKVESASSQDLAGQSLVCVLVPDFEKGTARGILANKEEADADNPTILDFRGAVSFLFCFRHLYFTKLRSSCIRGRMTTWKPTSMTHRSVCGIGTTWHHGLQVVLACTLTTIRATRNIRFRGYTLHNTGIFGRQYQQGLGRNTTVRSSINWKFRDTKAESHNDGRRDWVYHS